jgi:hypothetical protein
MKLLQLLLVQYSNVAAGGTVKFKCFLGKDKANPLKPPSLQSLPL